MSVKLVIIALHQSINADLTIVLRTVPGHSFRNPAERVNCILNFGLYGIGFMRARLRKKLHQCSNLADVSKLVHEDHENINLLKESCESTITLRKDIFGHLKVKENHIICGDVVEDEKVDEFFNDLNLDKNISPNETAQELSEYPLLERYLQDTCRECEYFSVKKCGKNDCTLCFAPRLPSDFFDTLCHLPDPEPYVANKGHCKSFHESFDTETSEKYLPSSPTQNYSHKIPSNPLKQHANNTRTE